MRELNCVSKRVKYSKSPQVGIPPIAIQSNGGNDYLSGLLSQYDDMSGFAKFEFKYGFIIVITTYSFFHLIGDNNVI